MGLISILQANIVLQQIVLKLIRIWHSQILLNHIFMEKINTFALEKNAYIEIHLSAVR